jgi:putative ABC transport system substrate-binding protein
MRRRELIELLGAAAAARLLLAPVFAQTARKRPLIACVLGGSNAESFFSSFRQGLSELGYREGSDYDMEVRYADGDVSRIPSLTEEVLRLSPDVIVSGTMAGVIAANKLTSVTPIVSEVLTDPIGFGVAASYARPGGNVTGVIQTVEGMPTKLLELALEIVPDARRIGLLVNPGNPIQKLFRRDLEAAAQARGIEAIVVEASSRDKLLGAVQRLAAESAKIVILAQDAMFLNERKRIALFSVAQHLPTIFGFGENVEDGGLLSYGTNLRENWRQTARFVDKILKGARPGDLPMEFPTRLELIVNLATAQALGLSIPTSVLARADEVIE